MNSLTANAPPNPPTKRHTTTPDKTAGLIPLSTSVSEQEMYDMSRINLDFPEHGCPKGPETKNLCFVINQLSWSCEWQITTTVFFVVIYPSRIRGEKKHLSYTPIVELISIFHTKKTALTRERCGAKRAKLLSTQVSPSLQSSSRSIFLPFVVATYGGPLLKAIGHEVALTIPTLWL